MDKTRALLDSLMGPNRDAKGSAADDAIPDFADKTVCKHFLVGFCPNDFFTHARRNIACCDKIHSEIMREQLTHHSDKEAYRAEYEKDFLKYIEELARDCDQFIVREQAKCRGPGGKTVQLPADVKDKVDAMEKEYSELIMQSEGLADESLTRSREKMNAALVVKADLDALKAKHTIAFGGEGICEVCGVKYPLGDNAHDKTSHYRGKTHEGFTQIREKLIELRGKKRQWEKLEGKIGEVQRKRQQREKEKEKEERKKKRKQDEEQEREREKEREKEAEREKDRDREREKRKREEERKREKREQEEKEAQRKKELEKEKEKEREKEQFSGMAALWERIQKMPVAAQRDTMAALQEEEKDRLEQFLMSRVAGQKKK